MLACTRVSYSFPQGAAANKSTPPQTGILRLGLSSGARDGYLFVPGSYNPQKRSAMILAIHAAGRGGLDAIGVLVQQANSSGTPSCCLVLLEPCSQPCSQHACPRDAQHSPACNA